MKKWLNVGSRHRLKIASVNLFLCIFLLAFLSGCATRAPKNFSKYKEGEWDGKVLIKNKREAKSSIVNVKIKAVDVERLRIDVTSTMGTHLVSMLLLGDRLEYLNVVERYVFRGQASADSLKEIFPIPLRPEAFYNILFDRSFEDKNWSCTSDARGLIQSCRELKTGLNITWSSRDGSKRTIGFDHAAASIQMNLFDFEPHVSNLDKVFQLKAPASFKIKK